MCGLHFFTFFILYYFLLWTILINHLNIMHRVFQIVPHKLDLKLVGLTKRLFWILWMWALLRSLTISLLLHFKRISIIIYQPYCPPKNLILICHSFFENSRHWRLGSNIVGILIWWLLRLMIKRQRLGYKII